MKDVRLFGIITNFETFGEDDDGSCIFTEGFIDIKQPEQGYKVGDVVKIPYIENPITINKVVYDVENNRSNCYTEDVIKNVRSNGYYINLRDSLKSLSDDEKQVIKMLLNQILEQ